MAKTTKDRSQAVDREKELKDSLTTVLKENEEIVQGFKVTNGDDPNGNGDGHTVEVEPAQRDKFRANLEKAREIREMLSEVSQQREFQDWATSPEGKSVANAVHEGGEPKRQYQDGLQGKSIGRAFTESEEFKHLQNSGSSRMETPWYVDVGDITRKGAERALEQKDVYNDLPSGGSFGTIQRDDLVPRSFRSVRVRDLFPVASTDSNLIEFFRVSGFVSNNAAAVADYSSGAFGLKPQTQLEFEMAQAPVRTLAHWEAAHRNALNDEPQLQSIIDNELLYGLRLVEDDQILNGDGTGENLTGIRNTTGVQSYNRADTAGDTKADAIRRAATRAVLANYDPTGVVIHPYDWEDMELDKDSNGQYILHTQVSSGAEQTLWRMPVVDTPAIGEETYLVGAFGLGAQLYDREQGNVRISDSHEDFFARNAIVVLAEQRLALAVKRPESFVTGSLT